jgi:hypothetical protein
VLCCPACRSCTARFAAPPSGLETTGRGFDLCRTSPEAVEYVSDVSSSSPLLSLRFGECRILKSDKHCGTGRQSSIAGRKRSDQRSALDAVGTMVPSAASPGPDIRQLFASPGSDFRTPAEPGVFEARLGTIPILLWWAIPCGPSRASSRVRRPHAWTTRFCRMPLDYTSGHSLNRRDTTLEWEKPPNEPR